MLRRWARGRAGCGGSACGAGLGAGGLGGFEFEDGGEEGAVEGAGLAADAAFVAEDGTEPGAVGLAVEAGVRGGEHLFVESGQERDGVGVVDAEPDALGDESGEERIGAIVFGDLGGEVDGAELPVFGEADFRGVEAVFGVVARGAGFAFGRAGPVDLRALARLAARRFSEMGWLGTAICGGRPRRGGGRGRGRSECRGCARRERRGRRGPCGSPSRRGGCGGRDRRWGRPG